MGVFGPSEEVGGGEGVEEGLGFVGGGVSWVDPVGVREDAGFGVGVPAGEDGVSGEGFVVLVGGEEGGLAGEGCWEGGEEEGC